MFQFSAGISTTGKTKASPNDKNEVLSILNSTDWILCTVFAKISTKSFPNQRKSPAHLLKDSEWKKNNEGQETKEANGIWDPKLPKLFLFLFSF